MQTASEQVAHRLRRKIIDGHWPPGSRLPDRRLLARELDTCLATVQEAVAQVATEGFLRVGPRRHGTFVADRPPHLHRYRVIFPFEPGHQGEFWRALEAALQARSDDESEYLPFYGLAGHRDISDYQAIVAEVEAERVAGLIFVSSAEEFRGTPLLEHPGIARVAIAGASQLPGIPKVYQDLQSFFDRALDHLLGLGRRRIAILCADHALGVVADFHRAMAARGLPTRRMWEQFADQRRPIGAARITELMFHAGQAERPDGFIVADDNLLRAATEGILAAGVRAPEDLTVVALTNFPHCLPAALPVTRLGFDVPGLLDLLVQRLEALRRNEPAADFTLLPAVFDHELR